MGGKEVDSRGGYRRGCSEGQWKEKKGGVVRRDWVQIPRSVNSAHKKTHRLTKSDAVVLNAQ